MDSISRPYSCLYFQYVFQNAVQFDDRFQYTLSSSYQHDPRQPAQPSKRSYLIKLCKYARRSRLLSKHVPLAVQAALAVACAIGWNAGAARCPDKVEGNAGAARCPETVAGAAAWTPGSVVVGTDAVEASAARL